MPHTSYTAVNDADRQEMFRTIGMESPDDLFTVIPDELRASSYDLPGGVSECEMTRHLRALASRNAAGLTNFCGAGFYDHFIPAAVDALAGRAEFYTAYTPYQPEAAQGTLQAIYEYQTMMVRLTDMEVSNASLYDGGTALFEGVMMALRITGRNRVLVDQGVNPVYRTMLRSYMKNLQVEYEEVPVDEGLADRAAFRRRLDARTGVVVGQNPNFFGCVDDLTDLVQAAHEAGALALLSVYPLSLGLLKTPGSMGADIVTGEGQSLGIPLSFGGPYLGFMTTRRKLVRKMPGRIVGATRDASGRRGFVLTLQTREQHIRREKANSNICSNEALCALRALIYLSVLGRDGLVETARACATRASYAWEKLTAIPGIAPLYPHSFFNEFALRLPHPASELISRLLHENMAVGFPVTRYYEGMENTLLVAVTEKRSREEIDRLAELIARVC